MQAKWIAEVFAKMPPETEVIAYWWDKEDVEMISGHQDAEQEISPKNWQKIVDNIAGYIDADRDLIEYIQEEALEIQPIEKDCTLCGKACHCDADYERSAGK